MFVRRDKHKKTRISQAKTHLYVCHQSLLHGFLVFLMRQPLIKWDSSFFSGFCRQRLRRLNQLSFWPIISRSHRLIIKHECDWNWLWPVSFSVFSWWPCLSSGIRKQSSRKQWDCNCSSRQWWSCLCCREIGHFQVVWTRSQPKNLYSWQTCWCCCCRTSGWCPSCCWDCIWRSQKLQESISISSPIEVLERSSVNVCSCIHIVLCFKTFWCISPHGFLRRNVRSRDVLPGTVRTGLRILWLFDWKSKTSSQDWDWEVESQGSYLQTTCQRGC